MEQKYFADNRRRLWAQLPEEDMVFICFSGRGKRRTADEDYPFYANRSFVYLTGLEQEDLVYMAWRQEGAVRETLFLPETDPMYARWMGRMLQPEQIGPISGISDVESRKGFEAAFHRLAENSAGLTVYLDFDPPAEGQDREPAQNFGARIRREWPWCQIRNAHPALRRLRSVKTPAELESLRESIRLTDQGIRAMLRACRPGLYEYQLRAVFEQVLADQGARVPAFDSIVAAGKNTLVMHYPEQDCEIRDGDLILVDVGAQLGLCGADISRVFPANGRFTQRQKALQRASAGVIDQLCLRLRPGMAMKEIDRMTGQLLLEALRPMGLAETLEDVDNYRWHSTSHHLGLDTHDDCDYTLPLAPGMVFTMEVGIYVPQWGEGVRVEDDILMTERGCENLSRQIPREIPEIEALMKEEA